jgi:hypothetical protein
MLTFVIGGLWHGAGWTFVFWGFLHGLALSIQRLWQKLNIKLPVIVCWFLTFNFVNVAWVFFRATSWHDAIKVLRGMSGLSGFNWSLITNISLYFADINVKNLYELIHVSLFIVIFFIIAVAAKNSMEQAEEFKPDKKHLIFVCLLAAFAFLHMNRISEFLYFQF